MTTTSPACFWASRGSSSNGSSSNNSCGAPLTPGAFQCCRSHSSSSSSLCSSSLLMCTDEIDDLMTSAADDRAAALAAGGYSGGCCDEAAAAAPPSSVTPLQSQQEALCARCQVAAIEKFDSLDDQHKKQDKPRRLAAAVVITPSTASHSCDSPAASAAAVTDSSEGDGAASTAVLATAAAATASRRRLPAQHRSLIVGWMRQVSAALRLHPSTLFNATSLLDRFVAANEDLPADGLLQLLALACMSVAVKYNETVHVPPSVWLGLAVDPAGHNLYLPRDLQRCEFSLLQTVDWRLLKPNTYTFLEHFLMCPKPAGQQQQQAAGRQPPGSSNSSGCGTDSADGAVVASNTTGNEDGCQGEDNLDLWGCDVTATALALAELSLLYDDFLSYDYSTVAMACVAMAERPTVPGDWVAMAAAAVAAGPHGGLLPPPPPSSSATVASAGLTLVHPTVGPDLMSCMAALEKCCWA